MLSKIKAKIVIAAVAAFAITGLGTGIALAQGGPQVNVKQGKFETAQQKNAMKAFRKKGGPKTDADVKQEGDKLFKHSRASEGMPQLKDDGEGNMFGVGRLDPSAHFKMNKETGDISFNKGMKKYLDDKATMGLPQGDKAVEMAKKHLTDLGLMPEKQEELVVRHIGGLKQVDVDGNGKQVEKDKLVTIHFGRKIDGVDVSGPGSKIVMDLGENGELVSLHRRWVEVQEEKKGPGDFALEFDVKNKIQAKLKEDAKSAKKVDSDAPDFGFFDDGAGNIEPAYFYAADLTYDVEDMENPGKRKEHHEKYLGVEPALKQSKAKFDQLEKAKTPPGKDREGNKDSAPVKD